QKFHSSSTVPPRALRLITSRNCLILNILACHVDFHPALAHLVPPTNVPGSKSNWRKLNTIPDCTLPSHSVPCLFYCRGFGPRRFPTGLCPATHNLRPKTSHFR